MSLILNIDTALNRASVCLAENGRPVRLVVQEDKKDNTAWLHVTIADMLKKNNIVAGDLQAVGVSIGPGSYTGLRVGLAAAKGLCYALQKPLVAISTLKMMALAAKNEATDLICPLIDARRMEVFTAIYDSSLREKKSPHPLVIDETSFASLLDEHEIVFCGNGMEKLRPLIQHHHATFSGSHSDATQLAILSHESFTANAFADLAYTEPLYIKEFYSAGRKS